MQPQSVVLSWGPPRMGTTWMFNVLSEMLVLAEVKAAVVADQVPDPSPNWAGPIILKSHRADDPALISNFDGKMDLLACVMLRDAKATFRSLIRTQTADRAELISWLEADVTSYEIALPIMRNVVVCREEWIAAQSFEVITKLTDFLDLSLDAAQCQSIAQKFSREIVKSVVAQLDEKQSWSGDFKNFDHNSQWHAGHIGPDDQSDVELSPAEAQRLDLLQIRIDALTESFTLWSCVRGTRGTKPFGIPAVSFASARSASAQSPKYGLFTRVRKATQTLAASVTKPK